MKKVGIHGSLQGMTWLNLNANFFPIPERFFSSPLFFPLAKGVRKARHRERALGKDAALLLWLYGRSIDPFVGYRWRNMIESKGNWESRPMRKRELAKTWFGLLALRLVNQLLDTFDESLPKENYRCHQNYSLAFRRIINFHGAWDSELIDQQRFDLFE